MPLQLAFTSLLISPFAGGSQRPPIIQPAWCLVALLSGYAILSALRYSALPGTDRRTRIQLGVAILISLLALVPPILGYYGSYHDFPWVVIIPLAAAIIVKGWRSQQRWISALLPVALFAWLSVPAQAPTVTNLPVSLEKDGLTVSIQSLERQSPVLFCSIEVQWKPGMEKALNLKGIRLEGQSGPLVPIDCWPANQWPVDPADPPNQGQFIAYTFPPFWIQNLDLTITVPTWPAQPAASVFISVPPTEINSRSDPQTQTGGGVRLSVVNVRWDDAQSTLPAHRCLAMDITYTGYSYSSGSPRPEVKVTDEQGRIIEMRMSSFRGSNDEATIEAELWPIADGVKRIRIDAYTAAQREQHFKVFRFRGLPNRTRNAPGSPTIPAEQ